MSDLNAMKTHMRMVLLMQAGGFFCWQAIGALPTFEHTPSGLLGPAFIISGMGFGLWVVSFILFIASAVRAHKLLGYDLFKDTEAVKTRREASETAFWITTVGLVSAMTLHSLGVEGVFLLRVLTGLAVASFLAFAAIYDGQSNSDAA